MPIYDMDKCGDLFEQWMAAYEREQKLIKATHEYWKSKKDDRTGLSTLFGALTEAHDESMRLYNDLQKFRID